MRTFISVDIFVRSVGRPTRGFQLFMVMNFGQNWGDGIWPQRPPQAPHQLMNDTSRLRNIKEARTAAKPNNRTLITADIFPLLPTSHKGRRSLMKYLWILTGSVQVSTCPKGSTRSLL